MAVLCIAILSACGYQLTAQGPIVLPENSTKLFLNKVTNPTTETWLEPMLRNSFRDELTRRGNVTWVGPDEAEASVNIDVRKFSTSSSVKGRDDRTIKSSASIQMEVTFISNKTNALIWTSGPVLAAESFRAATSSQFDTGARLASKDAIDLAVRMVADRLSEKF